MPPRPRNLTLEVHAIELRMLGDLTEHEMLYLECLNCGRLAGLDHQALIARHGSEMPLYDLRRLARCRTCHRQETRLLIKLAGIRGHLAWRPEPPKLGRD